MRIGAAEHYHNPLPWILLLFVYHPIDYFLLSSSGLVKGDRSRVIYDPHLAVESQGTRRAWRTMIEFILHPPHNLSPFSGGMNHSTGTSWFFFFVLIFCSAFIFPRILFLHFLLPSSYFPPLSSSLAQSVFAINPFSTGFYYLSLTLYITWPQSSCRNKRSGSYTQF